MRRAPPPPRQHGFTLVEVVVVIVVISVGVLGLTGLFGTAVKNLNATQDLSSLGQHSQACAEEVLAYHHKTNLVRLSDAELPTFCAATATGMSRSYTISAVYANDATRPRCPAQVNCRDVQVRTVSSTTALSSTVHLMLAAY